MYIEALGKNFPLCYTIAVQSELADKAGRLEDIQNLFDQDDTEKVIENIVWTISLMMTAAESREKVKCRMLGQEYKGEEPPTFDELMLLLSPGEIEESAMEEISNAMKSGQKTTVEVKEEKGKNAKATQ